MLESLYYSDADCCFLTLTQDDDNIHKIYGKPTLCRLDLQHFIKRLRINGDRGKCKKLKAFYACGEYGSKRGRPHYHVLCFGYCPADLKFFKTSYSGFPVYTSDDCKAIWKRGIVFVGKGVSRAAAAYVARYVGKKLKKSEYENGVVPEFSLSSRNIEVPYFYENEPLEVAIGGRWCLENLSTVARGFINDHANPELKHRIPRYFEKLLERLGNAEAVQQMKEYRKYMADEKCRERAQTLANLSDDEFWKRCDNLYHAMKQMEDYQLNRLETLKRNFEEE